MPSPGDCPFNLYEGSDNLVCGIRLYDRFKAAEKV